MPPTKREKSDVWNYYVNKKESGLAMCKTCYGTLKNNRVSNLKTHLLKLHNIKVQNLKIEKLESAPTEELESVPSEIARKANLKALHIKQVLRKKRKAVWNYFENNIESGRAKCKKCRSRLRNRVSNLKGHLKQQHNINLYYAKRPPMNKIRVNVNKMLLLTNRNDVWNYYVNNIESGIATCKTCSGTLKNNRVSNLKTHLWKVHNLKLPILKIKNEPIETATTSDQDQDLVPSVQIIIPKQICEIHVNKKQLLRSFIGLVTEDCIPLKVLDSPNMRNIIDPICQGLEAATGQPMPLNASSCIKNLKQVASNIRQDIAEELKNRLLSFNIYRLCRNFAEVSAQFLSDAQIKTRILGNVHLIGSDSRAAKNVSFEKFKKFNINRNQIVSVTYNKGSQPKEECGEHCDKEEYLKRIELVQESPNILFETIQACRCAADIAQICVLDATKSSEIIRYLFTCRDLTKYIRKPSNGYQDIFEQKKLKMPQLDCPTRWGSTYAMLEHLKLAKDVLTNVEPGTSNFQDDNFTIDESFWEFIESYCIVFSPLQKTIQKFQLEQLHYGNFYAQWLKCKICTEKIVNDATETLTTTIGNIVLKSIEKRTKILMSNTILISCLYLDPRFHHTLTAQQKLSAREYLKTIWDRINELDPADTSSLTPIVSMPNQSNESYIDEEDELLNQYLAQGIKNVSSTINVYTKIEALQLPFQRIDVDVLTFWQGRQYSDQELYAISKVCFAVPATQVATERKYSTLRLLADNYNQLGQEALANILLVKLNPNFLEAAIDNLPIFKIDQEEMDNKINE